MMYNNRSFSFSLKLAISIVFILFVTSCIKSSLGVLHPFPPGGYVRAGGFDSAKIDCSALNLLKINDHRALLCKAIDSNNISMLQIILKEIKSNPIKYPPKKIIELIAHSTRGEGKIPLLIRAINIGHDRSINHAPILELLFETLRYYDLNACEQVFLLKFGPGKYTVIHQAIHVSNVKIVVYLIEKYIKIKQDQGMDIATALSSLRQVLSIVNNCKQTRLDMAFSDYNFLHSENKLDDEMKLQLDIIPQEILDIVRYLLKYVDPPYQIASSHNNILHDIAERGDTNMLKNIIGVLEEKFKTINKLDYKEIICKMVNLPDGALRTPLHYAVIHEGAKKHSRDTVEYLMSLGANSTSYDKNGISPLFIAIAFNNKNIVQLLLDKNFSGNQYLASNINNQGSAGLTPLNWSIFPREKLITGSIARLFSKLASCNSDINAYMPLGRVSSDIVETLLHADANVLVPDNTGSQPLHRAVQSEQVDVVEMLLEHGADPLAIDSEGHTTLDILIKRASLTDHLGDGNGPVMKIFLLILEHILTSAKPVIGLKPYQGTSLTLYMGLRNFFKTHDWKFEPCEFSNYLTTCILAGHSISDKIICDYELKKRILDTDASSINSNKKRRKITVKECGSSSGRTHGT